MSNRANFLFGRLESLAAVSESESDFIHKAQMESQKKSRKVSLSEAATGVAFDFQSDGVEELTPFLSGLMQ